MRCLLQVAHSPGHKLLSMERAEGEPFSGWVCDGKGDQFPIMAKIVIDASGVAVVCSLFSQA